MIPSLEELRKSLVPELAPDTESKENPQSSTESARSVELSSSEFSVLCQSSPLFTARRALMCRMCLRRPEPAVVLRPKHEARPSQIVACGLVEA